MPAARPSLNLCRLSSVFRRPLMQQPRPKAGDADENQVDRDDEVEQARHDQDEDAGQQGDQGREGGERDGHADSPYSKEATLAESPRRDMASLRAARPWRLFPACSIACCCVLPWQRAHSPFLNPHSRDCPKPALFLRDSSPTRLKTHGDGFPPNVPHPRCSRPAGRVLRRERYRASAILSALLPRAAALDRKSKR